MREKFLEKLNKGLMSLQLPLGYLSIMVYVGIEPEKACRDKVGIPSTTYIQTDRQ